MSSEQGLLRIIGFGIAVLLLLALIWRSPGDRGDD